MAPAIAIGLPATTSTWGRRRSAFSARRRRSAFSARSASSASRSVSSSWLAEAFAGDGDRAAARVARRECILDAARRAAASAGELRTALVVVLKPDALADDDSPENGVSGLAPGPGDHF